MGVSLKKERNMGIELLRIVSMLMIVTLHVLKQGGVLDNVFQGTYRYYFAWIMRIACIGAVDLYALISGYVCVNGKTCYSRIMEIWLQAAVYCVGISAVYYCLRPESFKIADFINQFFPLSTNHYWYLTAYFIVFLFIPYLNKLINSLSVNQLKKLGILLFVLTSLWPNVAQMDLLKMDGGYCVLWITILYLFDALINKINLKNSVKSGYMLLGYALCTVVSFMFKFITEKYSTSVNPGLLMTYDSFTVLAGSICLFLFFVKLNIKSRALKGIIKTIAPASFGVYIIHTNKFVWDKIIKNRFEGYADMFSVKMIVYVVITAIAIYLICTAVDLIRIYLFKNLGLNRFACLLKVK
ncbi:MAG: acyltransferase [Clostridiales bacterium]|nr:acyltransferase [Clostridiales bacterium]